MFLLDRETKSQKIIVKFLVLKKEKEKDLVYIDIKWLFCQVRILILCGGIAGTLPTLRAFSSNNFPWLALIGSTKEDVFVYVRDCLTTRTGDAATMCNLDDSSTGII